MVGAMTGKPKKSPGGKGKPTFPTKSIAVRATLEWVGWVERGADHCRTDVSKLIDAALAEYLRIHDFEEKPPRRIP